jgi:chromosome segregation ATPase
MAEDFVTRDQHRADLAELRLELANTLASLDKRTELIVQDLSVLRRDLEGMRSDVRQEMGALRADLGTFRADLGTFRADLGTLRADTRQEIGGLRQEIGGLRQEIGGLRSEIGQEMRAWRQSTSRQLWVMIGVVTIAVLTGVIKLVFFP